MTHLKGFARPKSFPQVSKKRRFVVSPSPGPHPKARCMPLQMVLREVLHLAGTGAEAQRIIKKGEVLVDGRIVKDHKYPIGLFDVVSFQSIGKFYRMVPSPDNLTVIEIDKKEADKKLCRIENKTTLRGGRLQINLHDGKNIISDKDYSTSDSILISLPSLEVLNHVKKEKSLSMIIRGGNMGSLGVWEQEKVARGSGTNLIVVKIGDRDVEVPKNAAFPVGRDKPLIKVMT